MNELISFSEKLIAEIQRTQEPFAFWSKGTIPLFTFPPAPVVPEGRRPIEGDHSCGDTEPSITLKI